MFKGLSMKQIAQYFLEGESPISKIKDNHWHETES